MGDVSTLGELVPFFAAFSTGLDALREACEPVHSGRACRTRGQGAKNSVQRLALETRGEPAMLRERSLYAMLTG